ncbi:MAG: phosphotransferase family protein [Acidimicrobiales bacterium]
MTDTASQLAAWFAPKLSDAPGVRVDGVDQLETGHSAEMLMVTLRWHDGVEHERDLVVRLEPPSPGLLEPYDIPRQFEILRALEPTAVRVPPAVWVEPTGDVLGRPFLVMDRVDGEVFEREVPVDLAADPARASRMCESLVEQLAAIHLVDLAATGLDRLDDGRTHLARELARWSGEVDRWKRGPLPGFELLHATLVETQPEPCPRVTLVHGDPKPGNFAFVGSEVSAVFDWEMTTIGDPLTDIGWTEVTWMTPSFTSLPDTPSADDFVAYYQDLTGIEVRNRAWYRALESYKMAVIMFVGGMLFDGGHTDDLRLADMGTVAPILTHMALGELGITDPPERPGDAAAGNASMPCGPRRLNSARQAELPGLAAGIAAAVGAMRRRGAPRRCGSVEWVDVPSAVGSSELHTAVLWRSDKGYSSRGSSICTIAGSPAGRWANAKPPTSSSTPWSWRSPQRPRRRADPPRRDRSAQYTAVEFSNCLADWGLS